MSRAGDLLRLIGQNEARDRRPQDTYKAIIQAAKDLNISYEKSSSDKGAGFEFKSEADAENVYRAAGRIKGFTNWLADLNDNIIHVSG